MDIEKIITKAKEAVSWPMAVGLLLFVGVFGFLAVNFFYLGSHLEKATLEKDNFQADEKITVNLGKINPKIIKAKVLDSLGNAVAVQAEEKTVNDQTVIEIVPPRSLRPGQYVLEISHKRRSEKITQDFTWGVLALNTDKTVYSPGEAAQIDMAVLDSLGVMVCDAELKLKIQNPASKTFTLSTEDGRITVNDACNLKAYTPYPDYTTKYKIGPPGTYQMELTAETDQGTFTIDDTFEVKEKTPFDVQRDGPTRIYPPEKYPVELNIKANQDFSGVIEDYLPEDFIVFPLESSQMKFEPVIKRDDVKVITWKVDLKKGEEIKLGYRFKSPEISPQFYLLGPLSFYSRLSSEALAKEDESALFAEQRYWQIAVDDIETFTSSGQWVCPEGVSEVIVEAWGGGGGGGSPGNKSYSSGGGGGAYAKDTVSVSVGTTYSYTIGSGGVGGAGNNESGGTGGDTYWVDTSTVMAKGGSGGSASTPGGAGGSATNSVGSTKYAGGSGGDATSSTGGGGGGGAGSGGAGGDASGGTAGTGTADYGGDGGAGSSSATAGNPGSNYGGGGGGTYRSGGPTAGGDGAGGLIRLDYTAQTGINVSGTCKQTDESSDCTDTGTIRVAINGNLQTETQTTVGGTWQITGITQPSAGDVVTVYIEGASDADEAVAVTTYDGSGDIGGMQLIEQRLTIGNSDSRTIDNADLGAYDNSVSGSEDVFHDVDANNDLTVDTTGNLTQEELFIVSGNTYQPDSTSSGNVTTHDIEINGTLTADNNTLYVEGSWDNNGSFNKGTSLVVLAGDSVSETLDTGGSSFYDLEIDNGLVGYWKLDEGTGTSSTADHSSNGNDGTLTNIESGDWTTDVNSSLDYGNNSYALDFGGTTDEDYVDIGNQGLIDGETEASVCFWLYYDPESVSADAGVVTKWNEGGWLVWVDDTAIYSGRTDTISFAVDASAAESGRIAGSTGLVTSGQWDHYCGTFSGGNYVRLYKNGSLDQENTTSVVSSVVLTTNPIYIANSSHTSNIKYLDGKVDDVRVYNRALTSGEITDLANGTHPDEGTYTLQANLDVDNNLGIRTGKLDVSGSNYSVTVGGNYINVANFAGQSGTFTMNSSSGSQTIQSDPTFNNLDFDDGGGPTTFTIENQRLAVNSDLTITGGSLVLGALVEANAVTVTDTLDLANSGYTLTLTGSGQTTSRPLIVNGTLTENSDSTVEFTGSSATDIEAETYDNLTLNGSGTFYSMADFTVADTFTITSGTFDAQDDIITLSGTGTPFSNSGTLTENTSTFKYTGSGATTVLAEAYNNLYIHPGGTVTHSLQSGTYTISNNLEIGDGTNSGTIDANTNGATVTVSGNMTINPNGVYQADDTNTLSVAGDFTNNGTFTANGGPTSFNATSGTQTITGSTDFGSLSMTTGGRMVKFGAGDTFTAATDKDLTMTGTDCTNLLVLRSTSVGSTFAITDNSGGTTSASYVDVQDSNASSGEAITASNSVDSGNNANWSISAGSCLGVSLDSNPTAYSFQRKTFHDETNNVHWQFFHDGGEIEVRYSPDDGSTWNVDSNISIDTNDFSVWWASLGDPAEEYVFLAYNDSGNIKVRQGTLGSSSISWNGTTSTALDESGTYSYPVVTLDSSDYLWVGARYSDGSNYVFKTAKSGQTADTDPSTWTWTATPYQLSDDQTNANVYGNIVSLGSQNMYATFVNNTALEGCKWDNTAGVWQDANGDPCSGGSSDPGAVKIDDASNFGAMPGAGRQVVRDSSGNLWAVIIDTTNNDLEVWKSTDNGQSWTEQDSANSPLSDGAYNVVSAAVDSSDVIHVVFPRVADAGPDDVDYVTFSSGSWGTPVEILNNELMDTLDIALDSNDVPHVVIAKGDLEMAYLNKVGGSWNSLVSFNSVAGDFSSITIDDSNYPQISYIDIDNNNLVAELGNANNATSFTPYTADTTINTTDGQRSCSIAVDSSGNTWVAYVDSDDSIALYKHTAGTAWDTGTWTQYDSGNTGYEPSIAIDGSNIYAFYEDGSDNIAYDVFNGSSWAGETDLQTGTYQDVKARWAYTVNNDSSGTDQGPDSGSEIDYLFSDGTDVYYSYFSGSGEGSQDAIATVANGISASLSALSDSSGNVHLAYINDSNQTVYHERTSSWQTAVSLDTNTGNEYPSIAIDTAGSDGMYAFWVRNNDIFYKRACSPYGSTDWGSLQTLVSSGTNDWITAGYEDYGSGKLFVGWTTGDAAPLHTNWTTMTPTTCGTQEETPDLVNLMRHGVWFNSSGVRQPFTF